MQHKNGASHSFSQASIRREACYFDVACKLGLDADLGGDGGNGSAPANLTAQEKAEQDQLLIDIAQSNTAALNTAIEDMEYQTLNDLEQGASVLYQIASVVTKNALAAQTLDFQGREAAVDLLRVGVVPGLMPGWSGPGKKSQ